MPKIFYLKLVPAVKTSRKQQQGEVGSTVFVEGDTVEEIAVEIWALAMPKITGMATVGDTGKYALDKSEVTFEKFSHFVELSKDCSGAPNKAAIAKIIAKLHVKHPHYKAQAFIWCDWTNQLLATVPVHKMTPAISGEPPENLTFLFGEQAVDSEELHHISELIVIAENVLADVDEHYQKLKKTIKRFNQQMKSIKQSTNASKQILEAFQKALCPAICSSTSNGVIDNSVTASITNSLNNNNKESQSQSQSESESKIDPDHTDSSDFVLNDNE
ncbi:hypothetical protein HK100_010805 [Physocladia obscura]|uniref:Uncharacterized protein n=1 Tax=Physocladia obscura TaxID=109957 RepID=A0AAD5T9Q1_9FUNG|nr:hypothetical protein HK100_010805 [Physocladia obscura]